MLDHFKISFTIETKGLRANDEQPIFAPDGATSIDLVNDTFNR